MLSVSGPTICPEPSEPILVSSIICDVALQELTRIPRIVDLDAHVVEPPDVWSSRLPVRYLDVGPRIEHLPAGRPKLSGSSYVEEPGTDGPLVAWWRYEDHQASVKRTIAAAGYPAEEVQLKGVTYDEMRPGCWQPQARIADMDENWVEAQLCFPNFPRFCGQQFLWGKDRELALLCVRRRESQPHARVEQTRSFALPRSCRCAAWPSTRRPPPCCTSRPA